MKGVNIFLADGFEDIEALATCDILRRGGVKAQLVGISDEPFAQSSHGLTVAVDLNLDELPESAGSRHDFMIFPGGMPGSRNLAANRQLMRIMKQHLSEGGSLAAICAAPGVVLSKLDSFDGLEFTCYDGFQDALIEKGGVYKPEPAVTAELGKSLIITGRGPGSATAFAFAILDAIKGEDVARTVRESML